MFQICSCGNGCIYERNWYRRKNNRELDKRQWYYLNSKKEREGEKNRGGR